MRPSIPNTGAVDSTFRTLEKRLKRARKKINTQAAREMKGGDYGSAQKWMDIGRSVADFAGRVEAFAQEWKRLTKATRIANAATEERTPPKVAIRTRSTRTPAWKFCTAALQILVSRGGSASHEEVIAGLEQPMASVLTEKDRESKSPRNPPRWHGAVKKAYKQCQREGWIEKRTDGVWKITPKGRGVPSQESEGATGAFVTPQRQ
ncbi:MAG: winged helix-turn-helix domain-containing protein [Acidobacteria bacterium]|nr:winged helix-turn-helix domain-containing protein [Acidobacteriota bacterium]